MKKYLVLGASWMLLNVFCLALLGPMDARLPYQAMGDYELRRIVGGKACTYDDWHDCDGVPEDCNGNADVTQCSEMKFCLGEGGNPEDYTCRNSGEEQYKGGTDAEEWPTCELGDETKPGDTCSHDKNYVCYKTWTCPSDCESTQMDCYGPDGEEEVVNGWFCKSGTNEENAGNHTGSEIVGECHESL